MSARILYPSLLAALVLTGCNLAPKYTAPAPPVPGAFPPAPAGQGPAAADVEWRDFYTDPQLRQVMELALANNRDFKVAALNVEKAQAAYRIQRAALLPTVNADASATAQRYPASVSPTGYATTTHQYGVSADITSWEIDFFGRLRNLKQAALEQYFATEQAQRASQISLLAQVADAYLTLAADREALGLAQSTLDSQSATYAMVQSQVQVGTGTELDARRAETSVQSARVQIASFTRVVALDRSTLDLLVGAPVPERLLPAGLTPIQPLRTDFAVGLPSSVLANRPDILMAENQLKAANANIGAARAAYFPTVALTTGIGTADTQVSGLFKAGSAAWNFTPRVGLPIFDWGARKANVKVSKVDREIALATYEKSVQTAYKEVADALVQKDSLQSQRAAQETLVHAVAETYRLTQARYEVGLDGSLSVLDAQRSLYAAQQALITLRQAEMANQVTLYKALGGGARPLRPEPQPASGAQPVPVHS